jgi:hypothetical protein
MTVPKSDPDQEGKTDGFFNNNHFPKSKNMKSFTQKCETFRSKTHFFSMLVFNIRLSGNFLS